MAEGAEPEAGGPEGPMTYIDAIVWCVRVALPIILFWIWFRTEPKSATGGKHQHEKLTLLAMRDALGEDDEAPEQLQSMKLMPEAQVREALGIPAPTERAERGGKGGGKRGGGGKGGRGGKGEKGVFGVDRDGGCGSPLAVAEKIPADRLDEEERACLEALASFVAVSDKENRPQRVFLPVQGQKPPPPPPRKRAKDPAGESAILAEVDPIGASHSKNAEAQKVLKGAVLPKVGLKCADVAKAIGQNLEHAQVKPSEQTFALMVETCVNAGNLKGASDFLMKMESSGHCANPELLDKVMDLYSEARSDKAASPSAGGADGNPSFGALGALSGSGKDQGGMRLAGGGGGDFGGASKAAASLAAAAFSSPFVGSGATGPAGFARPATGGLSGGPASRGGGGKSLDELLGAPSGGGAGFGAPSGGGAGWGSAWSDDEDGGGLQH